MQGGFLPDWFSPAFWIGLAVLFAASWLHLRHLGLAVLTILGPLVGYALVALVVSRLGFHAKMAPLICLPAFAVVSYFASGVVSGISEGLRVREALRETFLTEIWKLVWSLSLTFGMTLAPVAAGFSLSSVFLAAAVILCGAIAMAVLILPARWFRYGEEFITTTNRLRERRERVLDLLTFTVQPRWGWSVSGIVLIFVILGFFGGRNAGGAWPLTTHGDVVLPVAGLIVAMIGYLATRDVRRTVAFVLSATALMVVGYWIFAEYQALGVHVSVFSLMLTFGVTLIPTLIAVSESAAFVRAGDNFAVASLRTFERAAIPTVFGTAGAVIFAAILGAFDEAVLILIGGVATLIVVPALITALYGLFPPRVSLEAYKLR